MRVVVVASALRGLSAAQTGASVARAWAALGAACAVVPMAGSGAGVGESWGGLTGAEAVPLAADGQLHGLHRAGRVAVLDLARQPGPVRLEASSSPVAGAVLAALATGPLDELWLDLPDAPWHDGGAGLLAGLGATAVDTHGAPISLGAGAAGLPGVSSLDLAPARGALGGTRLRLLTTHEQSRATLGGLRGTTSLRRDQLGLSAPDLLATDQSLLDLLAAGGAPAEAATRPGSGAAGGLGAAVQLLGGDVVEACRAQAEHAALPRTIAAADLVVLALDELEFGTMGGDLLATVVGLAQQALRPVVVVARHNWVTPRELRTIGVEQAFGVLATEGSLRVEQADVVLDEDQLTAAAAGAARTWSW